MSLLHADARKFPGVMGDRSHEVIIYNNGKIPFANKLMNVSLTPELEQFIQSQIASGKYASPEEVIVDALKNFALLQPKTPEELGWPAGFFEQTAGCLQDDPLVRYPQGEYEFRESLE